MAAPETNVANLVPAPAAQPDLAAGTMPPGRNAAGRDAIRIPAGRMPGRFETFEAHFERMRGQYGDRAVMVVLSGLPTNSDPRIGVTKRDVEVAIDKRLKALVPEPRRSRCRSDPAMRDRSASSPVDDVKRLAESIDFGKASFRGSRIEVVVVQGVHRVGAAARGRTAARSEPPIGAAAQPPR